MADTEHCVPQQGRMKICLLRTRYYQQGPDAVTATSQLAAPEMSIRDARDNHNANSQDKTWLGDPESRESRRAPKIGENT